MRHLSSVPLARNVILKNLSIGYNNYRCYHKYCTTHAEVDAVNKLKPRDKHKKPVKVDIMVIRITSTGGLCSSAPCHNCEEYMKTQAIKKGYKIHKIYYSTSSGEIETKILR
jgi:hypothetical protein